MSQEAGNIENSKLTGVNVKGKNVEINANDNVNAYNIPIYNKIGNKLTLLLSIVAITISLGIGIVLLLITLKSKEIASSEAFIGAIGGLMGICATIIVGFQIYNSVEINQKIKELNLLYDKRFNEFKTQQIELSGIISQTKKELVNAKASNKKEVSTLQSYVRMVQAIAISENQPFSAFFSWYYAMKYAVIADEPKTIKLIIENMEELYKYIKALEEQTLHQYINTDNQTTIEEIKMINIKNMPTSDNYREIQDKFEYFVSDIIQIVKKIVGHERV